MLIRRRFVVLACLSVVGLAGYLVVPKVGHSIDRAHAQAELAAALAGLHRLKVPSEFIRLRTQPCTESVYRCYRIDEPTARVAKAIRGVLASTGAEIDRRSPGCHRGARFTLCDYIGQLHGHTLSVDSLFYRPYRNGHYGPVHGSEVDVMFFCGADSGNPNVTASNADTVCLD